MDISANRVIWIILSNFGVTKEASLESVLVLVFDPTNLNPLKGVNQVLYIRKMLN